MVSLLYLRASQQVSQLQSLNEIRVPDHAAVLDTDLGEHLVNLLDLLDTLVQRLLGTEDADISLHSLLHGQSDLGGALGAVRVADLVEDLDGLGTSIGGDGLGLGTGSEVVTDGVGDGTTEDDQVQEGVGTKTVGTVDGDTGSLTAGEEARHDLVVAGLVHGQDLTSVSGRDTTHVVVDGREDGDGLLADVDTGENGGSLRDTGQTLGENLGGQVAELQVHVVLLGSDTTSLTNLHGHGSGDDITRGQILGGRGVTLHESLTLRVEKVTTLTTRALGNQATSSVDTSRVELNELQILVGETSTGNHGHTVTGTGVGRRAAEVGTAVTTGGEDSVLGKESVEGTVLLVVGQDTTALTIFHDQVEGEELNEVVGAVSQGLTVESVQEGVASSVSGGAASVCLTTLSVLLRLTTKGTLVAGQRMSVGVVARRETINLHLAILGSREGASVVL